MDDLQKFKQEYRALSIESLKSLLKDIMTHPAEDQDLLNDLIGTLFYSAFDIDLLDIKFDSSDLDPKLNCFTTDEIVILKMAQHYFIDKNVTRSYSKGGGRKPRGIRWEKP
ncbi:MAG: hypothetical protein GXX78_13885 [Bacteroidales bacterium]|nr:hypothetical protein [Bacteroidales bacterium]